MHNNDFKIQGFYKQLIGHSGCAVRLIEKNDVLIVQKVSKSVDYNKRLYKQYVKQNNFKTNVHIKVPTVFSTGYDKDLFYFEMEYIKGESMSKHIASVNVANLEGLASFLCKNVIPNVIFFDTNAKNVFSKKIYEIQDKIIFKSNVLQEAFLKLKRFNWEKITKNYCHGDLTFENIIVSRDNEYYLIDFLDSFYNSWLIDMAKIFQDLEIRWSYRNMEPDKNREMRLLIIKDYIISNILKLDEGYIFLKTIYYILLLNVLRIFPYAEENSFPYLIKSVTDILNFIELIENEKIKGVV